MAIVYDFEAIDLDGRPISLKDFGGKVGLIVNTASKCGFTPQYAGLEKLYNGLRDRGFVVLGFPCNQFGRQEPGAESEIGSFCQKNYGVSFPLFSKVEVNGKGAHPLFRFLKGQVPGIFGTTSIKWNFTKFLVDREGVVHRRYAPMTKPENLASDIEALL